MAYKSKHQLKIKRKLWTRPIFWIIFLAIFALGVVIYFLFFYQKFQIQNIQIRGNEKISHQALFSLTENHIEKIFLNQTFIRFSSKNILFVDTAKLENIILDEFPEIKTVEAKKKWPDTLLIQIEERQPVALLCDNQDSQNCFFLDDEGVIFQKQEPLPTDIIIRSKTTQALSLGQKIIDENIIEAIKKIEVNLKENFALTIKEARVDTYLILETNEGWKLYFDPKLDISLQITKMNALLKKDFLVEDRKKLEYIYLQYKDRAYFK